MNNFCLLSKFLFIQFISIILISNSLHAAEKIAYITSVKGEVRLRSEVRKRQGKWLRIKKSGVRVFSGDEFKVFAGKLEVSFDDGSSLLARDNTNFSIDERPNLLEEFLPPTTVLALAKKWYTHRNITIKNGIITADIKDAEEKWTSFETKSAFVGMINAAVSIEVDTLGNLQISCENGYVEVSDRNGLLKFEMERGKVAGIGVTDNGETEIQSIKGDILINAGFTKTALGSKAGVLIRGNSINGISISAIKSNRGPVIVMSGNKSAILDSGDALLVSKQRTGEMSIKAETGYVEVTSNGTRTLLKEGEITGEVEPEGEGLEEVNEQLAQEVETGQPDVETIKQPVIITPEVPDPPEQYNAASPSSL